MIAFLEYLVIPMMASYPWAETCCSKALQHILPPGDNPIAVNKYIISYHKKSCCDCWLLAPHL